MNKLGFFRTLWTASVHPGAFFERWSAAGVSASPLGQFLKRIIALPFVVAENELFVLGDNRNNRADSRTWRDGRGGGVPLENVGGRAWFLWFPWSRFGEQLNAAPVLPPNAGHLQPTLDRCLAQAPPAEQTRPPPSMQ